VGVEIAIPRQGPCRLAPVLAALQAQGVAAAVVMVDNVLTPAGAPLADVWHDVRLRTPAGMVTLRRHPTGVAVIVFGNADPALREVQRQVADTLRRAP
jgi:hypothetical protein